MSLLRHKTLDHIKGAEKSCHKESFFFYFVEPTISQINFIMELFLPHWEVIAVSIQKH